MKLRSAELYRQIQARISAYGVRDVVSAGVPWRITATYELGSYALPQLYFDGFTVGSSTRLHPTHAPTDRVEAHDRATAHPAPRASDTAHLVDVLAYAAGSRRADSTIMSDSLAASADFPRPQASAFRMGSTPRKKPTRPVVDDFAVSDGLSHTLFSGVLANELVRFSPAGEDMTAEVDTGRSDGVLWTDSGAVWAQDYTTGTYFEGPYVGASRSI